MSNESRVTYSLIPELDAAILDLLPEEGAMLGKFKPLGSQVKSLAVELADSGITSAAIAGRMGVMYHLGYAKKVVVQPVGNGSGWQRTKAGDEFVRKVKSGEEV